MNEEKQPRLFYCYSKRMKTALVDNGFYYIDVKFYEDTGKYCWIFEGTDELNYYKDSVYQTERDKYWK